MNVVKELLVAGVISLVVIKKILEKRNLNKRKRIVRKTWQEKWLQRREEGRGTLNMLRLELLNEDPEAYKNFLRMDNVTFKYLLSLIEPDISRKNTQMREAVLAEKRLAVTLRYLASGNTFRDLMFATRIHESTISLIVPDVCNAIIKRLMPEFIKMPNSADQWKQIADDFETMWNFPMCIGALDGKHINFQAPRSAGSFYYNYKGTRSIVLMALVDATYKFLYIDVGVNGRMSDGAVFRESTLHTALGKNLLNLPQHNFLPGTNVKVPYVIVGDDAFPLTSRIMKPFPQRGLSTEKRIFNYHLSRARRVVENAFGILANRFRILLTTINVSPEKAEAITLTCCILHNFLASKSKRYVESNYKKCNLANLSQQSGSRWTTQAIDIRQSFCKYFNEEGKVEWQNEAIGL